MKPRAGIYYSDFYLSDGRRIRKSLSTGEKSEAARREKDMMIRMESELKGLIIAPAKATNRPSTASAAPTIGVTLKTAFKRAVGEHERWRASKSPKTINDNYRFVSDYFKEATLLHEITDEAVFKYADKLRKEGKSPSTINQRLSLLSVLFKCSRRWPECRGVARKPDIIRQTVRKGRVRVLSYEEDTKVIKWFNAMVEKRAKYADMTALVPFLLDTGFRLSEALGLRSSDVQWESGLVPAWDTKADHPRMVPMTARVRALLEARKVMELPFWLF
jgi:integrase